MMDDVAEFLVLAEQVSVPEFLEQPPEIPQVGNLGYRGAVVMSVLVRNNYSLLLSGREHIFRDLGSSCIRAFRFRNSGRGKTVPGKKTSPFEEGRFAEPVIGSAHV